MSLLSRFAKPPPPTPPTAIATAMEPAPEGPCPRCGIASWPALFRVLGVRKEQLAADMGVSVATIRRLDQDVHHCTHGLVIERLRETVRHKASYRERLRAADGVWPWTEDLVEREGKR